MRLPGKTLSEPTLRRLKTVVFLAALFPLAKLGYAAAMDRLGANPIEKATRMTGYWALTFLLAGLAVTPLRLALGWQWLMRLRRMLGLFAFFYASLHFSIYLVLDQFFDWQSIAKDILKRPYISVGFPAFLLMLPLAATSTDAMLRKLGGKRWKQLHTLVYPCAVGGVVHFWWLVKKDVASPARFAACLAVLLAFRLAYRYGKHRQRSRQFAS